MKNSKQTIEIRENGVSLPGMLTVPEAATSLIIFVHGSGSSRFSSRNVHVSEMLNNRGLATLLFDLFSPVEEAIDEATAELRFDIDFLARRVISTVETLSSDPRTRGLEFGLFGASTGAAAALVAASQIPALVKAVVSRGGRPDLAGPYLQSVHAPTLLIVGECDYEVLELNRASMKLLTAEKRLVIVPRATHLFEEPGTLDMAARLAGDWFLTHMQPNGGFHEAAIAELSS